MKNLVDVFQDTLENSKGLTKSTTSKHTFEQSSDYIMNMDFASLYPSTMTMVFPNKDKKISKINKILDNINDNKRI